MRDELLNLVRNGVRCPESAETCADCEYHSTKYPMHCDEEAALVDMLIAHDVVIPVQCGECKHSGMDGWFCGGYGEMPPHRTYPNNWCSYGEKETTV